MLLPQLIDVAYPTPPNINMPNPTLQLSYHPSIDTGILIELTAGTELGRKITAFLKEGSIRAYTTDLNIVELRCIICKKVGWKKSLEIVDKLIRSRYIKIIDILRKSPSKQHYLSVRERYL